MKKNFFLTFFIIFALTQKSFAYSNDPKEFISEIVAEAKRNISGNKYKRI